MWGRLSRRTRLPNEWKTVRDWLLKASTKDTEDRVFRLLALKEVGATDAGNPRGKPSAAKKRNRTDGSWSQLDDKPGDSYANGQRVFCLNRAGGLARRTRSINAARGS